MIFRKDTVFCKRSDDNKFIHQFSLQDLQIIAAEFITTFKFTHPLKGITIRHKNESNTLYQLQYSISSIVDPYGYPSINKTNSRVNKRLLFYV